MSNILDGLAITMINELFSTFRIEDVLNKTTARCRTTGSSVDSSYPIVVSFDGASRESQDRFTYRPDPVVANVQPRKTILRYKKL